MKKFIFSVLCVAVFFIGLGGLMQGVGARFKSDERALELIRQARTAIGGETAINNVQSLSIIGSISKNLDFDGTSRVEQGEMEINLQLPNQLSKQIKFQRGDGTGERQEIRKDVKVIVMNGGDEKIRQIEPNGEKQKVLVVKKDGGDQGEWTEKPADGKVKRVIIDKTSNVVTGNADVYQNDLFRLTLALLLSAPQGSDVAYAYAGDGDVDGNSCDVVEARSGNSIIKLYLDKSTHLPRMINFQGRKPMVFRFKKDEIGGEQNVKVFERNMETPEMSEFQIRFSDYRSVNGVQFPHRWTQTISGNADETIDITRYEINPPNISEKFKNEPTKVMFRMKKPE